MTVDELKQALEGLDPEMDVVLKADYEDGPYRKVFRARNITAGSAYGKFWEWIGTTGLDETPVTVFIVEG